jgi:hypothetical protein
MVLFLRGYEIPMNNATMRAALATALVGAFAVISSAPAAADFSIKLRKGLACEDFAVQFTATGGDLVTNLYENEDGTTVRILAAGKGTVNTYTNVRTGESVTFNTAGSVTNTVLNPDGSTTVTSTGHNGLILFPGDEPEGPSTTQYIGRFVYTVTEDGVFILDEQATTGQEIDVCAELA